MSSSHLGLACPSRREADRQAPLPYPKLDLRKQMMRVLRILPSQSPHGTIECELHATALGTMSDYEALSYVWGDSLARDEILVNGTAIDISGNLAAALRRLRQPEVPRDLWVDAVCINQVDDEEKSHQVNLMKEIFSATSHAIIWLGDYPFDQQHKGTKESASGNGSSNDQVLDGGLTDEEAGLAFSLLKKMAHDQHVTLDGSPNDENAGLAALAKLMRLPWWTRVWTVQEAILPKKATLVYGSALLPLETFLLAARVSTVHCHMSCCYDNDTADNDKAVLSHFWDIAHSIRYTAASAKMDANMFCTALNAFRKRQASDPRDHVYGFLGLGGRRAIQADYSFSAHEVFIRSTRSLISYLGTLKPLLRIRETNRSPDLPTWVPDWCAETDVAEDDGEMGWLYAYDEYNASKGWLAPGCEPSGPVLNLHGIFVGRIQSIGPPFTNQSTRQEVLDIIAQWQGLMEEHSTQDPKYPRGGTYQDAFWRVMVADVVYEYREKNGTRGTHCRRAREGDEDSCRAGWGNTNLQSGYRSFIVTDNGMIGIGPRDARVGDDVFVLLGGRMPFILRPTEDGHQYIGQAYIHGIMDGELTSKGQDPIWVHLI